MRKSRATKAYEVLVMDPRAVDQIIPNADRMGLTALPVPRPLEVEDSLSREQLRSAHETACSKASAEGEGEGGILMSTNKEMLTQMVETVSSGVFPDAKAEGDVRALRSDMARFYEEMQLMVSNEQKLGAVQAWLSVDELWELVKAFVRVLHINATRPVLTLEPAVQREVAASIERHSTAGGRREAGEPLSHIIDALEKQTRRYKVQLESQQAEVRRLLEMQQGMREQMERTRSEARGEIASLKEELKRCIKDIALKNRTIYHYITQVSDVANEKAKLEDEMCELKSTERLYGLLKSKYVKDRAVDRFTVMREIAEYEEELKKQGRLVVALAQKDERLRELETQLKVGKVAAVRLSDTQRKYKLLSERVGITEAHSNTTHERFDRLLTRLEDKERSLMLARKEIDRLRKQVDDLKKRLLDAEVLAAKADPNPFVVAEFRARNEDYKAKVLELERKVKRMAVSELRVKRREREASGGREAQWQTPERRLERTLVGVKSLRALSRRME